MQATLQVGDSAVNLEYQLGQQMVVFSHGFGVRRDARGMFNSIAQGLPRDWGYVMFDYDSFDAVKNEQMVNGFAERLRRLQAVIDWTHQQADVSQVHAIGHSLGAITLASLAPEKVETFLLLAPPLTLGLHFAEPYTKRPTSKHDGHTWSIPRSDGSTTVVDDDKLAELINVDAEGELSKLAMFHPFTIILAETDQVLPDADYTGLITMASVRMESIERADHDFSGVARQQMVDLVINQLAKPLS